MSDSRQHQKPTPPLISTCSPTSAKPTLARAPRTVPARIRLPTAPSLLCMVGHLVELGRRCNCSPPPRPPLLLPPALLHQENLYLYIGYTYPYSQYRPL